MSLNVSEKQITINILPVPSFISSLDGTKKQKHDTASKCLTIILISAALATCPTVAQNEF